MPGATTIGGRGHGTITALLRLRPSQSSELISSPGGSTDMAVAGVAAGAGRPMPPAAATMSLRSANASGPASLAQHHRQVAPPPLSSLARSSAPVARSWGTIGGDDDVGRWSSDDDGGDDQHRHHGGYGDLLVPLSALQPPPPLLPGVTASVTGGPAARKAAAVSRVAGGISQLGGWAAVGVAAAVSVIAPAAAAATAAAGSAEDPIELWSEEDDD